MKYALFQGKKPQYKYTSVIAFAPVRLSLTLYDEFLLLGPGGY